MIKQISIAVIAALATAVVMGFFYESKDHITKYDRQAIADILVKDDAFRSIMIDDMKAIENFKGAKGNKGDTGDQGPSATICDRKIRLKNFADQHLWLHNHPHSNNVGAWGPGEEPNSLWIIKCY